MNRPPHQLSRRGMLHVMGAAAAAGGLAACGLGTRGGLGSGSGTLSLAYLGDATQQAAYNSLFDQFHKTHPNITIKPNGIAANDWGTFAQTIITQLAGGMKYDIIDVATEGQRLMSSKNVLLPLDDFIRRDRTVVDAYYRGIDSRLLQWTKQYGSPDGNTYFIPGGYNTVVMYCNTDVFEKGGVDLPQSDWTWEEFRTAGEQIKAKTGAYLLALGDGSFPFVDILPWLLTSGASTLSTTWNKATLDTSGAVTAASFVKELVDAGLSPAPGGAFDAPTEMARGKLATIGGGRWVILDVRRLKLVDRVRILNWPHRTQKGSPAGWDGFPILKTSTNQEAAWTFIKWLMSPAAGRFYAGAGGTNIPALNTISGNAVFLDDSPRGSQLLPQALAYATPIPSPEQGGLVQQAITVGWRNAITGLRPVAQALTEANSQVQPLL